MARSDGNRSNGETAASTAPVPRPLADERLLNFLVRVGKIDREQAKAVMGTSTVEGISAVEALDRSRLLTEEETAQAVATGLKLPLLHLPSVRFDESATKRLSQAMASRFGVVPVRIDKDVLILAMTNPFDQELIKEVEFSTGCRIRPAVAPRSRIVDAIDSYYKFDSSLRTLLSGLPETPVIGIETAQNETIDGGALSKQAEEAPIVKMVNLILVEAMKDKASDIHIEPGPNLVQVRYRINGILHDALQVPNWVQSAVVARIKVLAKLDITERRVPQDGRMRVRYQGGVIDLRISSLPTSYGEKLVMRVLDPSTSLRRLDKIGFSGRDLMVLRDAIRKPEGLILVTGPTGSGKTTTLYAIVQEILSPERNIVTVENPIEYEIKGVAQVEVNEKQGLTFAGALRSILRQDPDVILIGEIRDRETAEVAFQAAQTGHLVLSTLHTADTASTITRLVDLGIEPYLIASSLHAVIAQRLARTVCPQCAEPFSPDTQTLQSLGITDASRLQRGIGCPACHGSGYDSRTGVYEVLRITKPVQQLIESRAPESAIRNQAQGEGMLTLVQDAVTKIEAGRTTPDEVQRVIEVGKRSPACPQCLAPIEDTFTLCPFCLFQLRAACRSCGMTLRKEWQTCPFCGKAAEAEEHAAPPPPAPAPAPASTGAISHPQVLVVDDSEDVRSLVKATLAKGSFPMHVDEAANAFEAIGKVEINKPHLIILDIMMPGMDGFDLCKRLRANLQTALIPIIMLTARGDAESKTTGFLAGTDDYLVKPFDRQELQARVQRLLERTYAFSRVEEGAAATG